MCWLGYIPTIYFWQQHGVTSLRCPNCDMVCTYSINITYCFINVVIARFFLFPFWKSRSNFLVFKILWDGLLLPLIFLPKDCKWGSILTKVYATYLFLTETNMLHIQTNLLHSQILSYINLQFDIFLTFNDYIYNGAGD